MYFPCLRCCRTFLLKRIAFNMAKCTSVEVPNFDKLNRYARVRAPYTLRLIYELVAAYVAIK
jgi:hypothetical protein